VSAGRLLREARQAQGMHIAALASAIKVAPRKLELLEADRFDELPDATFTRALAQTVCRTLKIDAAPVLALLPRPDGNRLTHVGEGLNTPFRERSTPLAADDWSALGRPAVWAPVLLLVAAAAVWFLPAGLFDSFTWHRAATPTAGPAAATPPVAAPASAARGAELAAATGAASSAAVAMGPGAPAASAAVLSGTEPAGVGATTATAAPDSTPPPPMPASAPAVALSAPAATASVPVAAPADAEAHLLVVRARTDSWVEVVDARGKALLSRTVKGGESVGLDGTAPFRLRIGNAPATEVVYRGLPVDLASRTSGNIARLELP
jgi:cytoskeleton protein RodZ